MNLSDLQAGDDLREERRRWQDKIEALLLSVAAITSTVRRVLEETEPTAGELHEAMLSLRGQLVELLRTEGVTLFGKCWEQVDPATHSIWKKESSPVPLDHVVAVENEGVMWQGRVLQRAKVIVSNGSSSGGSFEEKSTLQELKQVKT